MIKMIHRKIKINYNKYMKQCSNSFTAKKCKSKQ